MIRKKLNAEKWKALMDDPQINPLAQLSGDKKTVSMKVNLVDVLDHPDQFGYTIEY